MYSWGDDTSTWKKPGSYNYGSAKAPYLDDLKKEAADKGPRTYVGTKKPNLDLVNPKGKKLYSESENPIILAVDGTGSMQSWPGEIFDRLPLFYQTLSKYKPEIELSFSVIGDAISDDWPLQISAFGKGVELDDYLKALHPEGRGGPGIRESYELFSYFIHEHCKTPNAVSPFLFIMGDEKFYKNVDPSQVEQLIGDKLQGPLDSAKTIQELTQRYDVYLLRKSYSHGLDKEIEGQWKEVLGAQKVIPIYDPERVVDVAMGLVAKKWGYFGDFENNLGARQDSVGKESVMMSLKAAPGVDFDNLESTMVGSSIVGDAPSMKSKNLASMVSKP
ncbi:hypothetical protein HN385_01450 [archaeon]|nr:hypothetical protein [archaeon]MBT3451323.1 hypothetical protein [archaeon]MBT6869361.1 hypothetical protein [archaeon]MBT7192524.1 hypothetical protein [archaeon]MBT7380600.1 hypothetical protein [archaeon]